MSCAICNCIVNLSSHHNFPKTVHINKRGKNNKTVVCKPHHRMIHSLFTNEEIRVLSNAKKTADTNDFRGLLMERLKEKKVEK